MPLFKCSKCGCVENTACCYYWVRKPGEPPLCSVCDPAIGQWHGLFERRDADGAGYVPDDDGEFLRRPAPRGEAERGTDG